jgi:hypothetical protein
MENNNINCTSRVNNTVKMKKVNTKKREMRRTSVCRACTKTDCNESAVGVPVGITADEDLDDDDDDDDETLLLLRAKLAA